MEELSEISLDNEGIEKLVDQETSFNSVEEFFEKAFENWVEENVV